jgi:hypothetical protein
MRSGDLAEFGVVAPKGPASLKLLEQALAEPDIDLPDPVREMSALYLNQIGDMLAALRLIRPLQCLSPLRRVTQNEATGFRHFHHPHSEKDENRDQPVAHRMLPRSQKPP